MSKVDCTPEGLLRLPAVRLRPRLLGGLKGDSVEWIVAARKDRVFDSAKDLARRAESKQHEMKLLASSDALMSCAQR